MLRKILAAGLIILLFLQSGCAFLQDQGYDGYVEIDADGHSQRRVTSAIPPQTKPNGQPYTLAYIDMDPYPITGMILYYIIMGFRDEGWISFDYLPFDPADTDAGALINWLAERDIGPYIRFDKAANYYTEYQEREYIQASLTEHIRNGTVDVVITMGTGPSAMAKSFELSAPVMIVGAVDPIRSGLVDSLEDSGNPNIWAAFDPTTHERQLIYYYDCIPFNNLGIVYYDESISSMNSYLKAAETLDVHIARSKISRIDLSQESEDEYYERLLTEFVRLVERERIDAFLLTTDIIIDVSRTQALLEVFTENNIPVFVQVGEQLVENGALMNVSALEMEGLGIFIARSVTLALTGTPLSELPQEFRNSPFLSLNLDVAERIGFKPTFDTLLACERVFTSGS